VFPRAPTAREVDATFPTPDPRSGLGPSAAISLMPSRTRSRCATRAVVGVWIDHFALVCVVGDKHAVRCCRRCIVADKLAERKCVNRGDAHELVLVAEVAGEAGCVVGGRGAGKRQDKTRSGLTPLSWCR